VAAVTSAESAFTVKPREYLQRRNPLLTLDEAKRRYAHGTRACYVLAECRCFKCRVANTEDVRSRNERRPPWRLRKGRGHMIENRHTGEVVRGFADRAAAIAEKERRNVEAPKPDDPSELVPARRARAHIKKLAAGGVGVKAIGPSCGVASSVLSRIKSGEIRRTRRSTEAKILSVTVESAARGSAKIDPRETRKRLDDLTGCGLYTKGWLAMQMGAKTPNLQILRPASKAVRADKAAAVRMLHEKLFAEDARFRMFVDPEGERERREMAEQAERDRVARNRLNTALSGWDCDEFAVRLDRLHLIRKVASS